MGKIKTVLTFVLCLTLMLSGCRKTKEIYVKYDYNATHNSKNNILKFESSDSGLDSFLNEFFERHSRYNEKTQIHNHAVGNGGAAWKEWEGLIGSWWDSSASYNNTIPSQYATKDLVQNWLLNPKIDNQGYVWCDDVKSESSWGMGWAFPMYNYPENPACYGSKFSLKLNDWTGASDTSVSWLSGKDGSGYLSAFNNDASEITFETPLINAVTFYSPFIEMGWSTEITNPENIDDLYVYYQKEGDSDYSDSQMIKYSEFCINGKTLNKNIAYEYSAFPMYLQEAWGKSETNIIKKVKFALKAKEGAKISGKVLVDFMYCQYDDRQANNVGNYINAAKSLLSYAQDPVLLKYLMPNARKAFQNYLTTLYKKDLGLISTEYYVGHDNFGTQVSGNGIGDGYWDVTAYTDVNMYCNLSFYRAVESMLYLEQMCEHYKIDIGASTIKSADMQSSVTYAQTVESLTALRDKVKSSYSSYFWNEKKGRFIAGYYGGNISEDSVQDNGYLMFNLEAVEAGIATDTQAKLIMQWINGDREIKGDNSKGSDIYKYEFAPRNTTKQNVGDYYFAYSGCAFGSGVHNGGAVMQTSYYDIIARTDVLGADNAYKRLKAIQSWYEKVATYGGEGWDFYRKYYLAVGIGMQGGATGGSVGLDFEFLEAALMYAAIPTGFFGIDAEYNKTLKIAPNMPSNLNYWKMENLTFANYYYDCSISKYFVEISGVKNKDNTSNKVDGGNIKVLLNKPKFKFIVEVNGKATTNYSIEGEKIVVKVPFENCKVEIIGK